MDMEKPPLGLRPRFVVMEKRLNEIDEAFVRYLNAQYSIPNAWNEERNEIIEHLRKKEPK